MKYEGGLVHNYQVAVANTGNVCLEYLALSYYHWALALAREIKNPTLVKKWTRNINLAHARIRATMDQQNPRVGVVY